MKKKLVATVIAAALVASVGIGSTLAYLQDSTETPRINTFTIGDVKIDLDEPAWNPEKGEDMIPGATVSKNPIVTNVGQTAAFIGVRVDGMKELVDKGFLVNGNNADLDAKYEDGVLADASVVFAWNPDYTLVDDEGNVLTVENDDALTIGEFKALYEEMGDTLYFAYESAIAAGAQTKPLFDTVKLDEDVLGAPRVYTIVKHFVDENEDVMIAGKNGLYAKEPKKNDAGEYLYKFSIEEAELVDGKPVYYDEYADAKAKIDELEAADETAAYEFNMKIKAAAIQSVNGSDDAWAVDNTTLWYPELPAKFFD